MKSWCRIHFYGNVLRVECRKAGTQRGPGRVYMGDIETVSVEKIDKS